MERDLRDYLVQCLYFTEEESAIDREVGTCPKSHTSEFIAEPGLEFIIPDCHASIITPPFQKAKL